MGPAQVPAFVVERRAGLRDFWAAYEKLVERSQETAMEAAFRQADFTPAARERIGDSLAEASREVWVLMRAAIVDDDWVPFVAKMRALGVQYAELDIEFDRWYAVGRVFQSRVVPALVEAYAGEPVRLVGALSAATALRDYSVTLVAEHYMAARQERLRQGEADRRGLEERFRALAGATPDAIITADHRGTITYANHATVALFGRPAAELVGLPLTVLMPARLREAHREGLARYLATREARVLGKTIEMPALRSDGTEIAIEMSITTWIAHGEASFAAIIRDVSERKRIAATLEQRTRQLETANRELDAFSYSVAHELRAPLRGMSGFAQILLEDHAAELLPEAAGHVARIQTNAKRMGTLIDALLGLARLAAGEIQVQPTNLTALARSVVAQLAAAEPGRGVEVVIEDGLRAIADPRLARTMLENLIGNAWKFTARTRAPRVAIGSVDGRTLFVRDNGVGFDLAQAGKLFSPFERLHPADEYPGIGIGLATVQRIVHRHGGRIWANAQPGAGATFFFTLAAGAPAE